MSNELKVESDRWQMSTEEAHAAGLDARPPAEKPQPIDPLRARRLSLYVIITIVFLVFFARLWNLQVAQGAYYRKEALIYNVHEIPLEAPRGIIYDRAGAPLVRNIPQFTIAVVPAYLPDNDLDEIEVYRQLSLLLNMPITTRLFTGNLAGSQNNQSHQDIRFAQRFRARTEASDEQGKGIMDLVDEAWRTGQQFRPVPLKTDVSREVAMIVSEQTMKLPGVRVQVTAVRQYPLGSLVSQIVGYVGPIPGDQDSIQSYKEQGYDPLIDRVGLAGIEKKIETNLRGSKGRKFVEQDAAGREVRIVGQPEQPIAGTNVYLSIDVGLQKAATDALQAEIDEINRAQGKEVTRSGAVIAMNPQNGQILAMVSLPTYDNNLFTRGISQTEFSRLSNDDYRPLMNHAIGDQIAPGSTFKLIPASAALEEKVITPKTIIHDPGRIVIPDKYSPNDPGRAKVLTDWLPAGHGNVDLLHALAYSCDVYFWEVGAGYDVPNQPKFEGLGLDRLVNYSRYFGLGRVTGIDLEGEAGGFVPTARWKRQVKGESWSTGDTYLFAIGQGDLTVTPLQMLNVTAAVANGGTLYKPQIVDRITDLDGNLIRAFKPQPVARAPVKLENLQLVQQGMEAAVMWGTSTKTQVPGVRVAGKTGTAEFCDAVALRLGSCYPGHTATHAWFVSFAPVDNPQIALVVYIYNGGEGSEHAVPTTKKILDYYFGQKPQPKP